MTTTTTTITTAPGNAERQVGAKALSDGCSRGPRGLHARPRARAGNLDGGVDGVHPHRGPGVLLQRRVRLLRSRLALEGEKRAALGGFVVSIGFMASIGRLHIKWCKVRFGTREGGAAAGGVGGRGLDGGGGSGDGGGGGVSGTRYRSWP